MKKFLCVITSLLVSTTFGCNEYTSSSVTIYPKGESTSVHIDLPGHTLDKGSPYEIFYSEDGCDVIIHFTKSGN